MGALRDDKKIGANEADNDAIKRIPYSHQVQPLNGLQIPQQRWVFQVRPGFKKNEAEIYQACKLKVAYNTPVNLLVYISPEHGDPVLLPLHPPQNIHRHYKNFHLPYQKRRQNKAKEYQLH